MKVNSHFIGRTLDECGIRRDLGIIIVAIKRVSGEMEFNPTSASVIQHGDPLIAMGEKKSLRAFSDLVGKG